MHAPGVGAKQGEAGGHRPTLRDVARHYDEMDDVYRRVWSDHAHHGWWRTGRESVAEAVEDLVDLVADAARVSAGSRVVDALEAAGTWGYGHVAFQVSDLVGIYDLVEALSINDNGSVVAVGVSTTEQHGNGHQHDDHQSPLNVLLLEP